ncbi:MULTISPECIES: J domain-containing protein [Spirulina sp. CCY15215]|uniref:J domain-containing protein n=1 Tax=Spirulina sp. CCY15215 TaxID=2767591 RepID=UPI00194DF467|nr:J domain-containing protein [Spirulina major]
MAKKKTKPASQANSELAFSLFHTRLEQLEKDHQWLLKQIKRKRTELTNFLEQMQAIALEIVQRSQPFHDKLIELDREIHSLFEEIFTTRKFGKQSRQKIEQVYRMLQMIGAISPKGNRDREDEDWTEEEFSQTDTENDADFHSDGFDREDNTPPNHDNSNANPELKQMRRSFLRLATIFHPDKVTDGENKEDYAEIMKEVNRAYEEGDMARLLEIERQYELDKAINLDDASNSEIERKCDRLEMENKILKTQYENIKLELRWMRHTQEGEMVKEYRSLVRSGCDPIEEMIKEAQNHIQEVEEIRNFVTDFRDKKITIKDFLKGPGFGKPIIIREEMQEMIEDLFSGLVGIQFKDF